MKAQVSHVLIDVYHVENTMDQDILKRNIFLTVFKFIFHFK